MQGFFYIMRINEVIEQAVTEVAPPGMEDWINDRKEDFKKRYGDKWESVLYATAWKRHKNESVEEAAPTAVRALGGAAVGAVSGIGGALIGTMFGGVLGSVAGGVVSGIGGAKAGVAAADAIWDKVASMFGGDEKAAQYGIAHAQAAQAGKQSFEFNGKSYPVTLKPQEAKPAVDALNAVKEGIVPAEKLDEITGWAQSVFQKKTVPQPKRPTAGELLRKSGDKRSALQRQKDAGKKNWFAEEELEEGWKEKMAAAALAGTMAFGASAGQTAKPGTNQITAKPAVTQQADANDPFTVDGKQMPKHLRSMLAKMSDKDGEQAYMAWRALANDASSNQIRMLAGQLLDKITAKYQTASVAEGILEENEKIGDKYDPEEFDAMIARLKKLAGQGELKTVWDPVKRVYKNIPVNQDKK